MIRIMLSARCGENRVSQAELARMTGIRRNTIGDYYNDFAERISLDHLDRICEALDCTPSDILRCLSRKESLSDSFKREMDAQSAASFLRGGSHGKNLSEAKRIRGGAGTA